MRKSVLEKIPYRLRLLALFAAVSMIHLYPILKNFFTMLPYANNGDVSLTLGILYSNMEKLGHLELGQIYHLPFLFPLSYAMTIGFTLFGHSLLLLPFFLFGPPNVYVLYNVLTILSYLAAGYGAYLFFREFQDDETVSVLSACLYILLPFRVANIPHLNLMFNFPAPFCFFFLLRYLKHGRRADLIPLNVFLLFQFLFDLSLGFYLSVSLAFFVLIHVLIARPVNLRRLLGLGLSLLPAMAVVVLVHLPFLQKAVSLSPSEPSFNPGQYIPALSFYANRSYLLLFLNRIWDALPLFPGFSVVVFYLYAFSGYVSNLREKFLLAIMAGSCLIPGVIAVVFYQKRAVAGIEALTEIGLSALFFSLALLVFVMRKKIPFNVKLVSLLFLSLLFVSFQPFPKIFDVFNAAAKIFPFLHRSRGLRVLYILPLLTIGLFSLGFKAFLEKRKSKRILLWVIALVLLVERFRWPVVMAQLPELNANGQKVYEWAEPYSDHYGILELPFLPAPSNTYSFMTRFHDKHTYHGYYLSYSDPLNLEGEVELRVESELAALKNPNWIQKFKDNGLNLIAIQGSLIPYVYDGDLSEIWRKIRATVQAGRDLGLYQDVKEAANGILIVLDDERRGSDIEYPLPYFALAGKTSIRFKLRADGPTQSRISFNGRLIAIENSPEGERDITLDVRSGPLESQINRLRLTSDRPVSISALRIN